VPAISNYETVSIGLNGLISSKLWHEIYLPSSKYLLLQLLTNSATRPAWNATEKTAESKVFESLHELKIAVVAMDQCFKKVMSWNAAFVPVAIFLHSIEFGEAELKGRSDWLAFVADFVDEILSYNAQAWDKVRHFMTFQEVVVKWAALCLRRACRIGGGFAASGETGP